MIADVDGRVLPVAPLVLDDAGSLEAMAGAVMRLHSTLLTIGRCYTCLLYTSPSPRDVEESRMPSSA